MVAAAGGPALRLQSVWRRTVLVIPIRVALGGVWLAAARLAGAPNAPALLAFAVGAFAIAFTALNDPRRRFLRTPDPVAAPADAVVDPPWRHAVAATFPSTAGLSVLAAIALVPQPTLTALLGGASAGLGVAALVSLPRLDRRLYVEPRSHALYLR